MATHSSILAWRIPGQRSLVGYGPKGHKRVILKSQGLNNKSFSMDLKADGGHGEQGPQGPTPFQPGFFNIMFSMFIQVVSCDLVLHFLLWPKYISLCRYTTFCLFICQLNDICFNFLTLTNNATMKTCVQIFVQICILTFLGIYLGVEWLSLKVTLCLIL